MTRSLAFCLGLLALTTGCSTSRPPLPEAAGPYRALNPGRWEPTADNLRGIAPAQPPRAAAADPSRARQP